MAPTRAEGSNETSEAHGTRMIATDDNLVSLELKAMHPPIGGLCLITRCISSSATQFS